MWKQKAAGGVIDLAYSPDGGTLFTVDTGGNLTTWDVATRKSRRPAGDLRYNSDARLTPLADGRLVVTADPLDYEPVFAVWDVREGQEVTEHRPPEPLFWLGGVIRSDSRIFIPHEQNEIV